MYQAVVSHKRANDLVEIHYLLQHDYTIMFSNGLRYSFLFAAAPLAVYDGDDTGAMFTRDMSSGRCKTSRPCQLQALAGTA